MIFKILLVAVLATSITYAINFYLKKGAVLASAIVTLSAGILLPYFFPDSGRSLAVVAAAGSYGAMVSKEKFPSIRDMIFVGLICGGLFSITSEVFVGVGGRLGSMAAISGFIWLGIRKFSKMILGSNR